MSSSAVSSSIVCSSVVSSVRRNLDFYVEISEATGKNSNKQQKKNSYGKSRYNRNKNELRLVDKAKTKGRHRGIQHIRHSKRKIFEPVNELAISTSFEIE